MWYAIQDHDVPVHPKNQVGPGACTGDVGSAAVGGVGAFAEVFSCPGPRGIDAAVDMHRSGRGSGRSEVHHRGGGTVQGLFDQGFFGGDGDKVRGGAALLQLSVRCIRQLCHPAAGKVKCSALGVEENCLSPTAAIWTFSLLRICSY